jgi:S-adenosylmethionine hydrolase
MKPIAFLSDFGTQDGFSAIVEAVVYRIAARAPFFSITDTIEPQNVRSASVVLQRCFTYFPKNTIFLVVVDPGVGTSRKGIAAKIGPYYFVGPDNGLITPLVERAAQAKWRTRYIVLTNKRYWLDPCSATFHGRDIFAPVAAHISRGVQLGHFGPEIESVYLIRSPKPVLKKGGIKGEIIAIDHFGNLISNITKDLIDSRHISSIKYKNILVGSISTMYTSPHPNRPLVYVDSDDALAIAMPSGNACRILKARIGEKVEILFKNTKE